MVFYSSLWKVSQSVRKDFSAVVRAEENHLIAISWVSCLLNYS